jgi:hypothetical protein
MNPLSIETIFTGSLSNIPPKTFDMGVFPIKIPSNLDSKKTQEKKKYNNND